jgi:hypothetical protein
VRPDPSGAAATDDEVPMSDDRKQSATPQHAVDRAARLLRLQIDIARCRVATVEEDPFVAGYLWGFCGGTIAGLGVRSLGLFSMLSRVARALFGERDGPRLLATIQRVLNEPAFEDGEAAGIADAWRSFDAERAATGLIAHLGTDGPARA